MNTKTKTPDDITKQLKVISNEIKQLKEGGQSTLESKLTEVGANVRGILDTSKESASEKVALASETIKKNPIRNTALAFAAGAVVAALLSRK